ncbi:MAG: hypothetical protein ACRENE_18115 [Polyangiaceae bacterium]
MHDGVRPAEVKRAGSSIMPLRVALPVASTLLVAACGGSSSGGAGGPAADYAYASGDAGGPASITISGAVVGVGASATDPITPLDGVMTCVVGHTEIPCVTTDAAGKFALPKMAPASDVGVSFTRTGYYGVVLLAHAGTADLALPTANLSTDAAASAFFLAAGWTYPSADLGVLHVHVQGGGQTSCDGIGQTTLSASTGATPVYEKTCADPTTPGGPDPTLTATTTSGNGDFLVSPGSVQATSTSTTLLCDLSPFAGWGWASTTADSVRAMIVAGHETLVALQCK